MTLVAPVKLLPVIVTRSLRRPWSGANESTRGATLNDVALSLKPASFVTRIGPVVAPAGTFVLISVVVRLSIAAGVPLKLTSVANARFVPLTVTVAPIGAAVGVKELSSASARRVAARLVPVPDGVVTAILPVVAVGGTVAMIVCSSTKGSVVEAAAGADAVERDLRGAGEARAA